MPCMIETCIQSQSNAQHLFDILNSKEKAPIQRDTRKFNNEVIEIRRWGLKRR